jgi:hypothetical protein
VSLTQKWLRPPGLFGSNKTPALSSASTTGKSSRMSISRMSQGVDRRPSCSRAMRRGACRQTLRNCLAKKQQAHRVLRPVGHSLQCAARTTFVLWFRPSCKGYRLFAVPHDARGDPHVALHAARGDPHVALHAARGDLRAALDAVPYRTLLERTSPERWVLERWVLERLAVPEPQHLTSLARWSAGQMWRLIREGKRRLDARALFHSCLISGASPRDTY